MTVYSVTPVNEEITFGKEEIIVSKTDLKGKLTYANDVFCRVAEMSTRDVIGQPHSIIRHPDMPRAVFKLLWDTIVAGSELFAYVKNMSKTGKYYWVFAHVTPSFDKDGNVDGYHSNRRYPQAQKVDVISKIYKSLLEEEEKHANAKEGLKASTSLLQNLLAEQDKTYSEFIWSLRG
jgi:PAS domain S-box-containing protein